VQPNVVAALTEVFVTSDTPEIAIQPDVLQKWQRIVDLLANIMQVPSAVVTKMEPPLCTS
jgi:hypothetical protein